MKKKRLTVSLVGAGQVGGTLAGALHGNGWKIGSIVNRSGREAIALARKLSCPSASTQIADIDRTSDLYLLAVPDGELVEVARSMARLPRLRLKGRVVLHTSGVHPADSLSPLRKHGAAVAAFHPIQTFPAGATASQLRARLRGIYFGTDGDDEAVRMAGMIAGELGGRILHVDPGMRPLYHAACVFASGYLGIMLNAVAELSRTAGTTPPWTEVFGPLMTTAMENTIRSSAGASLTGPVVRGDLGTLRSHLEALEKFAPQYVPLYTVSALEVARLAVNQGKIDRTGFAGILALFRSGITTGRKPVKKK